MHHHTKFHQSRLNGCQDIAFNLFKMAAVHHLRFFKMTILTAGSGKLICVIMQNFFKIGQTVSEISRFFNIHDGHYSPSSIFKFLVAHQIWRANMYHRTKFHLNRLNGCRDIAFNVFQNSSRLPSWIFCKIDFLNIPFGLEGQVHECAKFDPNQTNCC